MGDENHIRTLRDYSKPSHEGYRNTIKLPAGNNVVPLQSDTIWLVQNGYSFYRLRFEDPNQHLKDFLKLVDSLDLDGENRERTRLHLFQFSLRNQASNWLERLPDLLRNVPHHGLDLWLQIQIFYDHVDDTTQKGIDYVAGKRLRKLRSGEAWAAIERLTQYEDEE
uniref:Zinc finger, CCHC-type n=1 Tax=Tanacetum cinerariifolium TaxID=118510 RepID=A0A699JJ57_TANCI|nr:zinc finger, CCHC-type [Tanacetum cinerariifolium]GFA36181.1 zinc finger, CCHC-type [Tanacetum cinerariifolium]